MASSPTIIVVPPSTKSFYITALSLCPTASSVAVTWTLGTATFGATLIGPSEYYSLSDNVFGSPIITQEGGEMPENLSVAFAFGAKDGKDNAGKRTGETNMVVVEEPVLSSCDPAGSSKKVIIRAFDEGDVGKKVPIILTVLFKGQMRGLRN